MFMGTSCKIAPKWTVVQVTAGCRQTVIHYLNQCWPGSMTPSGVTITMIPVNIRLQTSNNFNISLLAPTRFLLCRQIYVTASDVGFKQSIHFWLINNEHRLHQFRKTDITNSPCNPFVWALLSSFFSLSVDVLALAVLCDRQTHSLQGFNNFFGVYFGCGWFQFMSVDPVASFKLGTKCREIPQIFEW